MIVLTIIIFTILVLLLILNFKKDGFTNPSNDELQKHIDEINHIASRNSKGLDGLNLDLYYYPYNDIYNKYKKNLLESLCKKKQAVDYKNEYDKKNIDILEDKYKDLRRQISPNFNPIFGDFLQLNTYNSKNNDKIKYLKVKRYIDKTVNPHKNTFQIYLNGEGTNCLEVDDYNKYKVAICSKDKDNQRFNLDYAYDKQSYEDIVKNPKFRYPEDPDLINYPVTLLRAKNGNCVNVYNNKVSIEPCKYKSTQMFKMEPV